MVLSHPTRVRGLKLDDQKPARKILMSHPTRVRGLKQPLPQGQIEKLVAPHTGAWIET